MKKGIHPQYVPTEIRCACGNVIETRSTKDTIMVQICSHCHPFYTGKQKLVDAAGRIDRFTKKFSGKTVSSQKIQKPVVQPAVKKVKEAKETKETPQKQEASEKKEN